MASSSSSRRRLAAVLAAAFLPVLAGGCAASFGAESVKPYIPADGVWGDTGMVKVRNVVLVSDEAKPGSGTMVATFLTSRGTDTLTDVTVGGGKAALTPSRLPVSEKPVNLGNPDGAADAPTAYVESTKLKPGRMVKLTFQFAKAAPLALDVLVVEPTEGYANVPAAPAPKAPAPATPPGSKPGAEGDGETPGVESDSGEATPTQEEPGAEGAEQGSEQGSDAGGQSDADQSQGQGESQEQGEAEVEAPASQQ